MRSAIRLLGVCAILIALGCSSGGSAPASPQNPGEGNPNGNTPPPGPNPNINAPDEGDGPIYDPRFVSGHPANPQITVASGFAISVFADGLNGPRHMTRRGNEVWVAERGAGRITVLRDLDGDGYAENKTTAISVSSPHVISYWRGWFYVGQTTQISRFRDDNNDRIADGFTTIITGLPNGGHITRTPEVNPFDNKLYVGIGSSCNLCEETDTHRAAIWQYNPDGTNGRVYASGLRNAVGIAFRPGSQDIWTVVNGWDNLGDFLPHECMFKVVDGGFYGWPYAYSNNGVVVPDPTFGPGNPAKVAETRLADFEFGAHFAPLGVTFWHGKYWGSSFTYDAFASFHGSWVPATPVGYKVGHIHFDATGKPVSMDILADNFRIGNNSPVGRPVDVLQFGNALLISDDQGGVIYRVDKLAQ